MSGRAGTERRQQPRRIAALAFDCHVVSIAAVDQHALVVADVRA